MFDLVYLILSLYTHTLFSSTVLVNIQYIECILLT
jgi:hypothetical protein